MRALVASAGTASGQRMQTLPLAVTELCYRAGGRTLVDHVSFRVEAGSSTIVLGPNGAGKSLLLRLCHGLIEPAAGSISWHGLPPARARARHAMIFQQPVMLKRSVSANVAYPLIVRGVPRGTRRPRVAAALAHANLTHLARVPATRLSGGEKQRVAIARARVLEPEVLLLDEPSANLDPRATNAVEELIISMRAQGVTVIMTTHDLAQARRLAQRVLFLNRGQLVEDAPAEVFFRHPRTTEAQMFLAGKLLI